MGSPAAREARATHSYMWLLTALQDGVGRWGWARVSPSPRCLRYC